MGNGHMVMGTGHWALGNWNKQWGIDPKSTPNRPQIDPKWTRNPRRRPKGVPGTIPDAFSGLRGRPKKRRAPPGDPKKTPKIEDHGKMTAAGATRDRQKDMSA